MVAPRLIKEKPQFTPIMTLEDLEPGANLNPDEFIQRREDKRSSRQSHNLEIAGSTPAPATKLLSVAKPEKETKTEEPKTDNPVGTACLPCTISHIAAVSGQLNEAVRFAREDIQNDEISLRIDNSLKEIAAAERIDLAPEAVKKMLPEEQVLAKDIANELRDIRHGLEWFTTADELESLAARASELQSRVGKTWLKSRLSKKN